MRKRRGSETHVLEVCTRRNRRKQWPLSASVFIDEGRSDATASAHCRKEGIGQNPLEHVGRYVRRKEPRLEISSDLGNTVEYDYSQ